MINISKILDIPQPKYDTKHEHSEYSPSGSKRWIECPASIQAIRKVQIEESSNFYAEEGTAAHALGEHCMKNGVHAKSQVGQTFGKFTVDDYMAKQVQKYIDFVEDNVLFSSVVWIENKISLEFVEPSCFGTADAIVINEDSIHIIDLKYGRGILVEPEENYQLMMYASAVIFHLRRHGVQLPSDFQVKLSICQPRISHPDGPNRTWTTTVDRLREFVRIARSAVKEAEGPNPSYGPSEDNCRWCPVGATCKARANYMMELTKLEFSDFMLPKREFEEKVCGNDSLTIDEMAKIYKNSKAIIDWLNSIAEHLVREAKSGIKIPGSKLVYGRSYRKWKDEKEVLLKLQEIGVPEDRLFQKKFKSPAQMEKTLENEQFEALAELIVKPNGKLSLVDESDPRREIDRNEDAKSDFADLADKVF